MSDQTIRNQKANQLTVDTNRSKIFLYENRSVECAYNNSAYDAVTIKAGTVFGRVTSTGFVKPLVGGATDGSQIPVGVLMDDVTIDGGAITTVTLCNFGDVSENKLILVTSTDTLDMTVTDNGGSSMRLRDRLHNMGLRLVVTREMTDYDN